MKAIIFTMAGILALSSAPAHAHHSAAMFDDSKTVKITGVVKEWQFVNPHAWLQVLVKEPDGKIVQWSFEGARAGGGGDSENARVSKDTFKPGDRVTISTHAHRSGRHAGRLGKVVFEDGRPSVCVLRPCDD